MLFEILNIKTKVERDLGKEDLKKLTKTFSQDEEFMDASMSVFVLMAHGNDNSVIFTADGDSINIEEDIIDLFDIRESPLLKDKPKWFIFQVIHLQNVDK